MSKQSKKKLLVKWVASRKISIGFTILLMGIYFSITALMHLDLSAVLYSTFLGLVIGLSLMIWDFYKFLKQYESIRTTYYNRQYGIEALGLANTYIEALYQELVTALYEDVSRVKWQMEKRQEEANDYYTLWTHQIKTPISAMRLLLQDDNWVHSLEEAKRTSRSLEEELFKIEQYADMALQYLRLESLSKDVVLKSYKLYDIVANALKKYSICFMGKKLSIEIEPFEAESITDEKWLQFVIEQIISNSIKYTQTGGIRIAMQDEKTLVISDTGIGIQSEDLPRIFDRGFTGYNGRIGHKSTGIGLYLCKCVIDKLGHTLEVQSTLGEGTSFYIGFPLDETVRTLQE